MSITAHLIGTTLRGEVVHLSHLEVCRDWSWLFHWEFEQPNYYARRAQQHGWTW